MSLFIARRVVQFTPMGELVGMILVKFRIFTDIFPIWWTVPYIKNDDHHERTTVEIPFKIKDKGCTVR